MSHNIRGHLDTGDYVTLHIADHNTTDRVVQIGFGSLGIGVAVGTVDLLPEGIQSGIVAIRGEDLYALRELLNDVVPEEAFVRPADPVEKPAWTDGDIILSGSRGEWVWLREDGRWNRNGPSGRQMVSDATMETCLEESARGSSALFRTLRQQSRGDI